MENIILLHFSYKRMLNIYSTLCYYVFVYSIFIVTPDIYVAMMKYAVAEYHRICNEICK